MSTPVYWPPETFFYPLGNTPAVSLTQDLSPEQSADVLLLGCGDPRNILYTLYADLVAGQNLRKIDITCCDVEPAVLARNIIMFTLLEEKTSIDVVFAVFYHFKISDSNLEVLVRQSKRLFDFSRSMDDWLSSSYGSFLRFLDSRTLAELRRYWKYYADFPEIPAGRIKKLQLQQVQFSKSVLNKFPDNLGPGRSAGMMWEEAATPINNAFRKYWKTGTTFKFEGDIKNATKLNPTFLYSVSGEVFSPHDQTFPQGFHLAPSFAPIAHDPVRTGVSGAASSPMDLSKLQFRAWCNALNESRNSHTIMIRFYSGDALALCRTLDLFANFGSTSPNILSSSWSASRISLDQLSVDESSPPTTFDVIDTSNVADHIGLLNLILTAQPVLKKHPSLKAVLYTEELIHVDESTANPFVKRLCASIPTLSVLLGLAPLDYISGFTPHSNVHEPLTSVTQCMERVAWVDPTSGDRYCDSSLKVLCFHQEPAFYMGKPELLRSRIRQSTFYHPETLAIFLQLVKRRISLKTGSWDGVVRDLLKMIEDRPSRPVELAKFQNLCLQLHLQGVYTADSLKPDWRTRCYDQPIAAILKNWVDIPSVLCVVMTVPRGRIFHILGKDKNTTGTLALQCNLRANRDVEHSYTSIHCVWGTCDVDPESGAEVLTEDPRGTDAYETKTVGFGIVPNHNTIPTYLPKLGEPLELFTSDLNDRHVKLLPYQPVLAYERQSTSRPDVVCFPDPTASSDCARFLVGVNRIDNQHAVISYTTRVEVNSSTEQQALLNGVNPSVTQIAPCTIKLLLDQREYVVSYPYPVLGSGYKLRVARKSHYIEVILPVSSPVDAGGYSLDRAPILRQSAYTPWNIHNIRLECMPLLDTKNPTKLAWINPHTALQLSDHERAMMSCEQPARNPSSKAFAAVKDGIHTLANDYLGFYGRKKIAVGLCEPNNIDHFYAVLLIGGLRLDLASFTIVIDTALIPATETTAPYVFPFLSKYMQSNPLYPLSSTGEEAAAWKRLLPAFIERARTWKHTANCEYTASGEIPISLDIGDDVICSCGAGIGFEGDMWKVPGWKPLLPFATRAAISPLFSVQYIESIDKTVQDLQHGMMGLPVEQEMANRLQLTNVCWTCSGSGTPELLTCSECKRARYCSTECQRQDWKSHKKNCQAS
ncbi:hypothetical protein FRC09_008807 [Ceratobasidium sp. 395]|nr:hypothetical protein FRC09_008807 [Ceratobasidium sp. 395]